MADACVVCTYLVVTEAAESFVEVPLMKGEYFLKRLFVFNRAFIVVPVPWLRSADTSFSMTYIGGSNHGRSPLTLPWLPWVHSTYCRLTTTAWRTLERL